MLYNTICFDLDNTLFSHEEAFEKSIQYCFSEYINGMNIPVEIDEKVWFKEFKKNSDKYWHLFEEKKVDKEQYRRIRYRETMKTFNLPYTDQEADDFHTGYNEIVDQFCKPYEGLEELLTYITQKTSIKIGIITNGPVDTQQRKIHRLGLHLLIPKEHIFISEEIGLDKPSNQIFDHAVSKMKAKRGYLYVGDSWNHDIVGAMEAGWDAIYINTRNETPSTKHTPIFIGRSFKEVSEWIKNNICFSKG